MNTPRKLSSRMATWGGIFISVACIIWLIRSVNVELIFDQFRNADARLLVFSFFLLFVGYGVRALRWKFLVVGHTLPLLDSFRCLILGFFMNNVLPARLGELVRAQLGGRAMRASRAEVLGTIASERLADGVMISVIFITLFGATASPAEQEQGRVLYYIAYLFGAAGLITALILYFRKLIYRLFEKLSEIIPGRAMSYALLRARRFIEGLEALRHGRQLLMIVLLSLVVWSIELFAYLQVVWAFQSHLSLGGLSLFLAAANYSSLIPAAPGGIGVIEAFTSLALSKIGVEHEHAVAMVATQHALQFLVVGIPGLYFFFTRLRGRLDHLLRQGAEEELRSEDLLRAEVSARAVHNPTVQPTLELPFDLSIVIPAYNEESRLPLTLKSVGDFFKDSPLRIEIIVVDDGSIDRTSRIVLEGTSKISRRILINPANRGKGFSARFGMYNAQGKLVLLMDADGATPMSEYAKLESEIHGGADIAIGSRALPSGNGEVRTVMHRKLLGRVFNRCVNVLAIPGIHDTQCGFKLFRNEVARHLFQLQRVERFSFDVEILYLARKFGYVVSEVSVNWNNIPGSKVNLVVDSASMFRDLLRIRLWDVRGLYSSPR